MALRYLWAPVGRSRRMHRLLNWPMLLASASLAVVSLATPAANAAGDSDLRTIPPRPVPSATHPLQPGALPTPASRPHAADPSLGLLASATDAVSPTADTLSSDELNADDPELQIASTFSATCAPVTPTVDQRILVISADGLEA